MRNTKDFILKFAAEYKRIKTSDILHALKNAYSRQYISRLINQLVKEDKLLKGGSTAGSFYVLPENKHLLVETLFMRQYDREGLEEHRVLDEISQTNLYLSLKDNIQSIFNYTFSEMLNNAIEHSNGKRIKVEVSKIDDLLYFLVEDNGVGVFKNIKEKKHLNSELEAIQDLLKGKTTTDPQAHTGEGIFFTSKISDRFSLDSYGIELVIDNDLPDVFFGKSKHTRKGTRVLFEISLDNKKHLVDLFRKYQSDQETMAFDKTEIKIKLFILGTVHVSRSQARRVLHGLEKFNHIILDFDKVPMIGQGFADEIFRVFKTKYPNIELKPVNMNEAVKFMIDRVERPSSVSVQMEIPPLG